MSPDDDDELIGFRDFIDGSDNKAKSPTRKREKNNSGFELLSFLENESKRLEKQNEFLEEKVYMLKNFPGQDPINHEIDKSIEDSLETLYLMLMKKDSPFFDSLNEVLKQFKPD